MSLLESRESHSSAEGQLTNERGRPQRFSADFARRLRPAGTGRDTASAGTARLVLRLSDSAAGASFAAGLVTYAFGGFLVGPPVMNGSARGTALVIFLVGAPALLVSGRRAHNGSTRALLVWAGMAMFLTYNSFMLLAATPLNRLFLLYVAAFGLAVATMIGIGASIDVADAARRFDLTLPARPIAVYLGAVVALNALAWLARIIPATVDDRMSELLEGMGLSTVPTYLQDLGFWLPLLAIGAWLLWHRRPWGYVLAGAGLAFWALEAATIAVDQWFGHRADPTSDVASIAVVVPFAVLTVISVAVLWSFLRYVDRRSHE